MTIKIRNLVYTPPPELVDERQRQEELYALNILGTAAEERFNQYAKLVATVLDVPIASISFVDQDRQWFESVCGLDVGETPREISFCAHALAEDEVLVVADAQIDSRFVGNPLVQGDPGIRFYAGAVIRGPNGNPLGTCCAVDRTERELSDRGRAAMLQIVRIVEAELRMAIESANDTGILPMQRSLDAGTGLPDSTLFNGRLSKLLDSATESSESVVLAVIRVDRFDGLEAALGREAAAYLVGQLANRIRETTSPDCLIGHAGDDKVCIALPLASGRAPESVLDEILECTDGSFALADYTVSMRVSIGASVYPCHAPDGEKLLKRARTALWSKPKSEQSGYRVYRRQQSHAASRYFRLQSALKRGMERDEFHLVYQPKIDIRQQRLVGAEALLRWKSEKIGDVSPLEFIPAAEKSGFIIELGAWVLTAACQQMARWAVAGCPCPELAVNITSSQLRRADFYDSVKTVLAQNQLSHGQLNLELTESSLVDDIEGAVKIMSRLRKLGVTFSIDDFGTGFSSLSYLRKMPVSVLKIDSSFIMNIPENVDDMKLVRSIVSMGHDLDMVVVAEGAETEPQLSHLRSIDCDQVQGYVYSRPLSSEAFEHYLRTSVQSPLRLAQ